MKAPTHAIWCLCLLTLTGCAPSPKRRGVDVEKTVAQVEEVLRQNANLPRLSRDDIMQLLNDIRAEDERSASASAERATSSEPPSNEELIAEIQSDKEQSAEHLSTEELSAEREHEQIEINEISDETYLNRQPDLIPAATSQGTTVRPSPRPGSLMVVLPYTPRDGASLQELYTRPPRVALLRAPAPMRSAHETLADGVREESNNAPSLQQNVQPLVKNNSVRAAVVSEKSKEVPEENSKNTTGSLEPENVSSSITQNENGPKKTSAAPVQIPVAYPDVSSELREFLQQHGLHGNSGSVDDHFLLPLDGFKPLPPVSEIDGSVDLPENILLTYDLLSPPLEESYSAATRPGVETVDLPPDTYVFEPLRPDLSFELDTLSSEQKKTVVPLDAPNRNRKAIENSSPNYSPIDYDSVRVIPLKTGPDPLTSNSQPADVDVQKRQSENSTTTESPSSSPTEEATTVLAQETTTTTAAPARDSSAADTGGSGPSIADLESSFGAPAPADESEAQLPPPRKNGFYWMLDWNSFLEVGDGDDKVNIHFEPKLGDPQMFLPVSVP